MSATINPYEAPSADLHLGFGDPKLASSAVALRSEYLRHEGAVRSIGTLYFLSSAFFVLMIPSGLMITAEATTLGLGIIAACGLFAALFIWMGISIRRLDARVRLAVGILSGIGLLNLPIGTLINGYILLLVFGEKGKVVFSEEYARAREQTPHMKYKTPRATKICLLVLLALIVAGLLLTVMAP